MIPKPLIVGLGSSHGDDQAGWLVIDRLRECGWPLALTRIGKHPTEVLNWSEANRPLVVCDACEGSGTLGTRKRWNWPQDSWPHVALKGTHDLPLSLVLELGQTTGRVPPHVIVWTIEGGDWSAASTVSTIVSDAASLVAAAINVEHSYA